MKIIQKSRTIICTLTFGLLIASLSITALATNPFEGISMDDKGVSITNGESVEEKLSYGDILEKYKDTLMFIGGFIIATAIFMMIYRFYKLSVSGANDAERKKAISGIMMSGICLMMLGSISLVVGIAYNMFS